MTDEMILPHHPHADQRNWQPGDDDAGRHGVSDLDRFIRSVRRLNKLLMRYDAEDIAKELVERGIGRDLVQSTGEILESVWTLMPEEEDSWPECVVCGGEGEGRANGNDTLTRANNIYCSPKCRQKAYRDRIRARDGKHPRTPRPSVTKTRNVTDSPVNVAGHSSRAPAAEREVECTIGKPAVGAAGF